MGCISTNSLSWHKPALQQLLSEGTPPFPFLCLIPGPVQLLSPCWHQHTCDCEVNQARKLCQLKTKHFFPFPRLVSTWMSSLMWFIAGPQEHLCWHKVGSSRGSEEECGLRVWGRKGYQQQGWFMLAERLGVSVVLIAENYVLRTVCHS